MKRLLLFLLFAAACGREESVAEKSAAAYGEAQAKGVAVGGGHDHGHQGATPATATTATDHAAHGTMDHAAMGHGTSDGHATHGAASATDHAAMGHGTSAGHAAHGTASATDHAAMGHGATGHAAQGGTATGEHAQHGTAASGGHAQHGGATAGQAPPTAAHAQHGTSPAAVDPHAQHGGGAQSSGLTLPGGPEAHTTPGGPLRADPFDAAAPSAVAEAQKARGGGGHEGHDMPGITPGQDKENPPTPMPATRDRTTTKATATDHSQHENAQVIYTCPMHPEVTSTKPGTCPKCGMALVEKK